MSGLRYASDMFADCECAIETLCVGCPDERGWAFMENPRDPVCPHMLDDLSRMKHEGAKPIVMEFNGEPFCAVRYEKHVKGEYELYQKRMRGDWS